MNWIQWWWGRAELYNRTNDSCIPTSVLIAIRAVSAVAMVLLIILEWVVYHHPRLLWYLTMWGSHLTCLTAIIILVDSILQTKGKTFFWRASLINLETVFPMNVVITLVFWTMLLDDVRKNTGLRKIELCITHVLPFVISLTELCLTRWVFNLKHSVFLVFVAAYYLLVNFTGTQARGKPLYPMLTWQDSDSAVFCVSCFVLLLGIFFTVAFLKRQ